jgi:tRNA pseudouridine13 synthase
MLGELIHRVAPAGELLQLKLGRFPTSMHLSDEQRTHLLETRLPLPSARLKWEPDAPWAALVEHALQDQGFPLAKMKLPGLREPFFSRGDRSVWVMPQHFAATMIAEGLLLSFELPRGSYATIVVKQLQAGVESNRRE